MGPETLERLLRELAQTRRYFDDVGEDLRGDIRRVAGGVAAVRSRIERFEAKVDGELTETRSMIKLSYTGGRLSGPWTRSRCFCAVT